MKSKNAGLAGAAASPLGLVVGMIIGIMPAQADSSFFPIVHAGDVFTGQFSIDPATPLDPGILNYYHFPLGSNFWPSSPLAALEGGQLRDGT
jgi:hypothetical protein